MYVQISLPDRRGFKFLIIHYEYRHYKYICIQIYADKIYVRDKFKLELTEVKKWCEWEQVYRNWKVTSHLEHLRYVNRLMKQVRIIKIEAIQKADTAYRCLQYIFQNLGSKNKNVFICKAFNSCKPILCMYRFRNYWTHIS